MQVLSFPGCCTARVIAGFGQEPNASARPTKTYTLDTMKAEIDSLLRGYQVGKHCGLVFATLTTRQTMGIQALTELGWTDTGAKDKTGHSETDLHGFYVNPIEYLKTNPQAYRAAPVAPVVHTVGMVKDLNRRSRLLYNQLMRRAREAWSDQQEQNYRERARALLTVPANFEQAIPAIPW